MVRHTMFLIGVLALLFIAGCSFNNIEILNKENSELKQKNIQLENDNRELTSKINTVQKNSVNDQTGSTGSNEALELTKKEAKVLRSILVDINKKNGLIYMFNPYNLEVGDRVGSFTVKSLNTNQGLESVSFEGSFTVTGMLVTNILETSAFSLLITKSEFNSIPYSIRQIDSDGMLIDITNSKDEIVSLLGKYYIEPEYGNEFKTTITATFSEYDYRFKDMTDMVSRAKLVKLISIDK